MENVSGSIIFTCFRKCGFPIVSQPNEVPQIAPILWGSHPTLGNVPFENYVRIDAYRSMGSSV